MAEVKEKILLDTDIGSDIDDAICLAYLLAQPECELLGITTVTGESEKRCRIASAICKSAGKKVPIYPGCETPLLIPQRQRFADQAKVLDRWDHDNCFPKGQAIEFLRDTIRKNPGEVTLLTIGPLTNIALLFKADPEIPSMLKRIVLMCGAFELMNEYTNNLCVEWNAELDYHSTAIVYNAPVHVHRSIGYDVTLKLTMSAGHVRQYFQKPLLRPVMDFCEVWLDSREEVTFHDPLAAVTIFDDKVCRFKRGNVDIDILEEKFPGTTQWMRDENGRHEVALEVDAGRFFTSFFSVF